MRPECPPTMSSHNIKRYFQVIIPSIIVSLWLIWKISPRNNKLYAAEIILSGGGPEMVDEEFWRFVEKTLADSRTWGPSDSGGNNDWSSVTSNIHVYSAYWESRASVPGSPFVRIIALGLRLGTDEERCHCVTWFNGTAIGRYPIQKIVIKEHWSKTLSAQFFKCLSPFPPTDIMVTCGRYRSQWKPVMNTNNIAPNTDLALCVRPFFGPFKKTDNLAEFIAFYGLMGVSRFTFYDYKTNDVTLEYLSFLKQHNFDIRVLPWSLPEKIDIWQMGQLAFIQDCIYRHMRDFGFVIIVDVDEFLVPSENRTLVDIVRSVEPNVGSIMFRNSFFCKDFSSTNLKFPHLVTQSWLLRNSLICNPKSRSKQIFRTQAVVSSSIHEMQVFASGFRTLNIDPERGLLQHYQVSRCDLYKTVVNATRALQYGDALNNSHAIKYWYMHFK